MSKLLIPLTNEAAACNAPSRLFTLLTSTVIFSAAFACNTKAQETAQELPTVSVVESSVNDNYNATESGYHKFTRPLVDTPRTVTTVTRQLMDDQGVTKVSDALRNVPGITLAAGEGGNQGDNLMIRGFSARNDFFMDGMRDFGNYFRDPFNIETIDVVQGPSSVLFGRGSTGGVVQQNSKQAFLGTKKEASFMLGTNDTARAAVDANSSITAIDGAAFRLNAVAHTNKVAERDAAQYRRAGIAPSLAFGLGTDTRLTLSHLHQNEDNIPDYGIPFYAGKPVDTSRSNFYGFQSDDHLKTDTDISTVKFEHDFSKDLKFRNQTRYARYARDVAVTEPQISTNPAVTTRIMKISKSVDTYLGNQTDLTSKFKTFDIEHELVTGALIESETSAPTVYDYDDTTTDTQNPAQIGFNDATVTTKTSTKAKIDTLGVYALDTIKLSKKWELSLGARFDNMQSEMEQYTLASNIRALTSRTDNLTSYSGGIVYKPAHNGSIYFNHGISFNPSAEALSLSAVRTNLKPEKNKIYEVGTKWDLFKKRLSTTLAVFRIDKENARETINATTTTLSGEHRVDGFLFQISGKLTDQWNVMAGYSYLNGRVLHSDISPTYNNRALANTPEHSASLFTTYKLPSELEIGGGANFVSERFVNPTSNPDAASGTVRNVPSYLTFNLMAKYPVTKNITMQLNANNITNKYYYDQIRGNNAVVPGEGRVLLLTTNIKF